jgi:hypothetical protein
MELKLQDYSIGDYIKIRNNYLAIVTEVDNHSLKAIAFNYPHNQNQIFIITDKYINNITKVTHA